jgi:hypothetical protein
MMWYTVCTDIFRLVKISRSDRRDIMCSIMENKEEGRKRGRGIDRQVEDMGIDKNKDTSRDREH